MEILNKFWSLMTTENEIVTKILVSPTIFIEAWLSFEIFTTIYKIKYSQKQKLVYIFLISFISKISEIIIPIPYNVLFNYFIIFIILKLIFKLNVIQSILCEITPIFLFALVGNLILNPTLKILNLNFMQINNIPLLRINYLFIYYFVCYVFCLLIKIVQTKINFSLNIKRDLDKKNQKTIILNLLFGLITIFIQIVITFYYINIYSLLFTLLNFISLFAYFSISFYSLIKTMKLQITTKSLESAENYNTTLTYLYDNVRAFKHDFDNMVFIIGGFIDKNDISGLKQYYKNLEKDCERVNNLALLNPELINNSGIYNLLMAKYKKAEESKVEIHLEFFFDFNKLKMPIYDFSRILGILLDNAIEAAKDTNEKQVFIIIRDSMRNNTQIVNIKNNYINKNIDTTKIFEKGITEKANHTGMGLWEVNQILRRNNNVNLITKKDDIYFEQNLEIYY